MNTPSVCAVVGDVHGHLQLALGVLAEWQRVLGVRFDAVFLCGDVGTFTDPSQLDNATRSHARRNRCELEFLEQWATVPPAPWLDLIFRPEAEGGLGLSCPVVMVHGNHEGFAHLERLVRPGFPRAPVPLDALPGVDTHGHVRLLPSGWRAALPSGHLVGGVGGIQGRYKVRYHPMAYLRPEGNEPAVSHLRRQGRLDLLLTHQGPEAVQGEHGSAELQRLLDAGIARAWFHGHSTPHRDVYHSAHGTQVVPLGDVAFHGKGTDEPGADGWALATLTGDAVTVRKETPPMLRDFRRHKWTETKDGLLVCPPLARRAWSLLHRGG